MSCATIQLIMKIIIWLAIILSPPFIWFSMIENRNNHVLYIPWDKVQIAWNSPNFTDTMQPRLSGLAGDQKMYYHACKKVWSVVLCGFGYWLSDELGLHRHAMGKTDWPEHFSEHCWPWSYSIGIVYRLGITNQVRNVGISVIWTFRYGSDQSVD